MCFITISPPVICHGAFAFVCLPSRGPGDLEAALIIENVIEHVASALGLPPHVVRERNFRVPEPGAYPVCTLVIL